MATTQEVQDVISQQKRQIGEARQQLLTEGQKISEYEKQIRGIEFPAKRISFTPRQQREALRVYIPQAKATISKGREDILKYERDVLGPAEAQIAGYQAEVAKYNRAQQITDAFSGTDQWRASMMYNAAPIDIRKLVDQLRGGESLQAIGQQEQWRDTLINIRNAGFKPVIRTDKEGVTNLVGLEGFEKSWDLSKMITNFNKLPPNVQTALLNTGLVTTTEKPDVTRLETPATYRQTGGGWTILPFTGGLPYGIPTPGINIPIPYYKQPTWELIPGVSKTTPGDIIGIFTPAETKFPTTKKQVIETPQRNFQLLDLLKFNFNFSPFSFTSVTPTIATIPVTQIPQTVSTIASRFIFKEVTTPKGGTAIAKIKVTPGVGSEIVDIFARPKSGFEAMTGIDLTQLNNPIIFQRETGKLDTSGNPVTELIVRLPSGEERGMTTKEAKWYMDQVKTKPSLGVNAPGERFKSWTTRTGENIFRYAPIPDITERVAGGLGEIRETPKNVAYALSFLFENPPGVTYTAEPTIRGTLMGLQPEYPPSKKLPTYEKEMYSFFNLPYTFYDYVGGKASSTVDWTLTQTEKVPLIGPEVTGVTSGAAGIGKTILIDYPIWFPEAAGVRFVGETAMSGGKNLWDVGTNLLGETLYGTREQRAAALTQAGAMGYGGYKGIKNVMKGGRETLPVEDINIIRRLSGKPEIEPSIIQEYWAILKAGGPAYEVRLPVELSYQLEKGQKVVQYLNRLAKELDIKLDIRDTTIKSLAETDPNFIPRLKELYSNIPQNELKMLLEQSNAKLGGSIAKLSMLDTQYGLLKMYQEGGLSLEQYKRAVLARDIDYEVARKISRDMKKVALSKEATPSEISAVVKLIEEKGVRKITDMKRIKALEKSLQEEGKKAGVYIGSLNGIEAIHLIILEELRGTQIKGTFADMIKYTLLRDSGAINEATYQKLMSTKTLKGKDIDLQADYKGDYKNYQKRVLERVAKEFPNKYKVVERTFANTPYGKIMVADGTLLSIYDIFNQKYYKFGKASRQTLSTLEFGALNFLDKLIGRTSEQKMTPWDFAKYLEKKGLLKIKDSVSEKNMQGPYAATMNIQKGKTPVLEILKNLRKMEGEEIFQRTIAHELIHFKTPEGIYSFDEFFLRRAYRGRTAEMLAYNLEETKAKTGFFESDAINGLVNTLIKHEYKRVSKVDEIILDFDRTKNGKFALTRLQDEMEYLKSKAAQKLGQKATGEVYPIDISLELKRLERAKTYIQKAMGKEIKFVSKEGYINTLQREIKAIADQVDRTIRGGVGKLGAEPEKVEKGAVKIGERITLGVIKTEKLVKVRAKSTQYVSAETALRLIKNGVENFVVDVQGIQTQFKKVVNLVNGKEEVTYQKVAEYKPAGFFPEYFKEPRKGNYVTINGVEYSTEHPITTLSRGIAATIIRERYLGELKGNDYVRWLGEFKGHLTRIDEAINALPDSLRKQNLISLRNKMIREELKFEQRAVIKEIDYSVMRNKINLWTRRIFRYEKELIPSPVQISQTMIDYLSPNLAKGERVVTDVLGPGKGRGNWSMNSIRNRLNELVNRKLTPAREDALRNEINKRLSRYGNKVFNEQTAERILKTQLNLLQAKINKINTGSAKELQRGIETGEYTRFEYGKALGDMYKDLTYAKPYNYYEGYTKYPTYPKYAKYTKQTYQPYTLVPEKLYMPSKPKTYPTKPKRPYTPYQPFDFYLPGFPPYQPGPRPSPPKGPPVRPFTLLPPSKAYQEKMKKIKEKQKGREYALRPTAFQLTENVPLTSAVPLSKISGFEIFR